MTASNTPSFPDAPKAYERQLPTLLALPAADVAPFRALVPQAVANIIAVAGAFAEDRGRMAETFKKEAFDPALYEDLSDRAQALWHADHLLSLVLDPANVLPSLLAEGVPLRKKMLRAAQYLWSDDAELNGTVEAIQVGRGHLDTADDLGALAALFQSQWAHAQSRCDVTQEDIQSAQRVGGRMLAALGPKAPAEAVTKARDVRDRAAAHARKGVDEVRAAAAFIHRNNPAAMDRYPSVFVLPGSRRPAKAPMVPAPTPPA